MSAYKGHETITSLPESDIEGTIIDGQILEEIIFVPMLVENCEGQGPRVRIGYMLFQSAQLVIVSTKDADIWTLHQHTIFTPFHRHRELCQFLVEDGTANNYLTSQHLSMHSTEKNRDIASGNRRQQPGQQQYNRTYPALWYGSDITASRAAWSWINDFCSDTVLCFYS